MGEAADMELDNIETEWENNNLDIPQGGGNRMTEQELLLVEQIRDLLLNDCLGKDCPEDDECENCLEFTGAEEQAAAILTLIKQAGYVQITRDEAQAVIGEANWDIQVKVSPGLRAKLRERLEVKDA